MQLSNTLLTLSDDPKQQDAIASSIKTYQTVLRMLIQSTGGGLVDSARAQSESDLLEALDITEHVIQERLSTTAREWKNDHKQKYQALFNSIEKEAKEAVQINFSSPSQKGVGFVISKFEQLVIEPIVQILRAAGPDQAKRILPQIISDSKQVIFASERQFHVDDVAVARKILLDYSKRRAGTDKPKKMTKQQRLQLIRKVVERMQLSEDEVAQEA